MKKIIYLSTIAICSLCFVSCEEDAVAPETHSCTSCDTEHCVCEHKDSTSAVCASCGMENCTMGCAAN